MKWLKQVTPLFITAITFFIILMKFVLGNDAAEVKSSVAFIALPVIGGCLIADFFIKKGFKQKLIWIWITEMVLLLAVAYLWVIAE